MKAFVSYSTADQKAVLKLAESLKAAGVEVWLDKQKLLGSRPIWDEIRVAIENHQWFIPIISNNALDSSWFYREVRHAYRNKRHNTLPVLLGDDVPLDELPKWLSDIHAPSIDDIEKILSSMDSGSVQNLVSRARAHGRAKRLREAIASYEAAIRITNELPNGDESAILLLELARAYRMSGKLQEALNAATQSLGIKSSAEGFFQRAKAASAMGDIELAVTDFRNCLKVDPHNPFAANGLGVMLFKNERVTVAETAEIATLFENALDACAKNPKGCRSSIRFKLNRHLGMVLDNLARAKRDEREPLLRKASDCFRNAVQLQPNNKALRFQLGYAELRLSRFESAVAHFNQASSDSAQVAYFLGLALFCQQEFKRAKESFHKSEKLFSEQGNVNGQVVAVLGATRCLIEMKDLAKAHATIKATRHFAPNDRRAMVLDAEILEQLGETKAAVLAESAAKAGCVRALELISRHHGVTSKAGREYAAEARRRRDEKTAGILTRFFRKRPTSSSNSSLSFDAEEFISTDDKRNVCQLRGWKCDSACCF